MKNNIKLAEAMVRKMPSYVFHNTHGEQFNVYSNGILTFLGGSEVKDMVDDEYKIGDEIIPLFNPQFSIWSKEELCKLGMALIELNKEGNKQ